MNDTPNAPDQPVTGWIDALAQQPQESEHVLINDWSYGLDIGWYDERAKVWYSNRHEDPPPIEMVTHWMPLPKAPYSLC